MLRVPAFVTFTAVTCTALTALVVHAENPEWGINGTYAATSNGEWARKNEVFYDQASLRSTWTVSTQCSYPGECTGTVQSDFRLGRPPSIERSGVWYVKHTVENWIPCPDGSTAPGLADLPVQADDPDGANFDHHVGPRWWARTSRSVPAAPAASTSRCSSTCRSSSSRSAEFQAGVLRGAADNDPQRPARSLRHQVFPTVRRRDQVRLAVRHCRRVRRTPGLGDCRWRRPPTAERHQTRCALGGGRQRTAGR